MQSSLGPLIIATQYHHPNANQHMHSKSSPDPRRKPAPTQRDQRQNSHLSAFCIPKHKYIPTQTPYNLPTTPKFPYPQTVNPPFQTKNAPTLRQVCRPNPSFAPQHSHLTFKPCPNRKKADCRAKPPKTPSTAPLEHTGTSWTS